MDKKCLGCGAIMQSKDSSIEGFIAADKYESASICERCFRINNYGDYKNLVKDNNTFINILKTINSKDLVILVMDLFNMPEDIEIIKQNISNPVLLVLTKRDILPKIIFEERLLNYTEKYGIDIVDKIVVSSNKNYNFDELISKIKLHKTSNKVYVIGFTNAGKSTLINKLIYNYSDNKPMITTSMLPSTTLNSIEIKFDDDMILIDTPGLLTEGSIENYIDVKTLKKITPKNEIKPITYQVKSKQYILIDDLVKLELSNNNITIFMANTLKIDRYYKDKSTSNLIEHIINVEKNNDVVISGLGFIKITKKERIKISIPNNVKIYTRKSLV